MKLIEWINGITKLNKSTMEEFQNNISEAIEEASESGGDGILTGSVIGYNGDTIPEGYEEVKKGYSTEEYFTGKYWIDGKPIYGKVIDLGLIPDTNIIINYSVEIGVENVIDYKGRMVSLQVCSLLPAISGEIKAELNVYSVNQVIFIDLIRSLPGAWTDRNLVVTLEYTKTTD